MTGVGTVALHALRESVRRRTFHVVLLLSAIFVGLYGWGASAALPEPGEGPTASDIPVEIDVLVGATILGLSMFATLFLGAVLATFLTMGALRGEAERGLLQPLVVRPIGRSALIVARLLAAGTVCALYAIVLFGICTLLTGWFVGWWPDAWIVAALKMAGASVVVAALSLAGSVRMAPIANGIAVLMLFGAGLISGLLGQLARVVQSSKLESVSEIVSWILPFEALYQGALSDITGEIGGATGFVVSLGPLGGANPAGVELVLFAIAYVAVLVALTCWRFSRRDL